jgi:hypothetical protein
MPRRLDCLLLCEDIEQEQFFRPILKRMFGRVHVEPRKPPAGINFVFESYARLVTERVRRYPQQARGLVVVVDGHKAGTLRRLNDLNQRLEMAGHAKRDAKEKIAACIPCRTVETWELWLCGRRDLNESDDYKADWQIEKRKATMDAKKAAAAWFCQLSQEARKAESTPLPSLRAGRAELDHLASLANKT